MRNLDWVRAHGLVDERSLARYNSVNLLHLAAYGYPYARGADLVLGADLMAVWFIVDDQFDGPISKSPGRAARVCEEIISVFHQPAAASDASPIATAFADVWCRISEGMSPGWLARAAHDWELYFSAAPYEAATNLSGIVPDRGRYHQIRRLSDGMDSVMDMCERLGGFEVPSVAFQSPQLREMRRIVRRVPTYCNDLYSLAKEEPQGQIINIVLVIEKEQRCTRQDAVQEVCGLINEQLDRFGVLQAEIPQLCDLLELSAAQRDAVHRYVEALALFMSGHHEWELATSRYSGRDLAWEDHLPGHTRNLLA
ncbi:terpene synthase family protein [Kitasatospora kifunensis]|uniref:Terpene synthase n=1 Tax=Kitasatospora kifunensis TaxID=58351 RepID=A0A7W7VTR6_KITKI|nr:terpene cyclase [Kitasatospora kifunensis]MBB4922048.1 pentalenene synthase/avermitilol synthase [Kitasatospora kifunensis]